MSAKHRLLTKAKESIERSVTEPDGEVIFYVTTANGDQRGIVWRTSGGSFAKAWLKVERYLEKFPSFPRWVRIEVQKDTEVLPASECIRRFSRTKRNNYFDRGIAFKKDGSCSFLPEEISGNALLVPDKDHKVGVNFAKLQLDMRNIRGYIKRRFQRVVPDPAAYFDQEWALFRTEGIVIDEGELFQLEKDGLGRGMRQIQAGTHHEQLKTTILKGRKYLFDQLKKDGSFIYGYYPAYNKVIPGYNSVRHFSSLYALLETLEFEEGQEVQNRHPEWLKKIEKSIAWGLENLCISVGDRLFVAEEVKNGKELKLGAQAVAILALAKYETVTGDDFYHRIMENLMAGIEAFVDETGKTTHVLKEDLSVKEAFRIVYYDGEALFAIMRGYPLTKDKRWLDLGERLMDRFVEMGYEKYHDHWLSYSVNELTQYLPKRSYFEFGVKNALENLAFMEQRDTAYPTFLELLCGAAKMFQRINGSEFAGELFTTSQQRRLWEVTEKRMLHELRTGVMWPEYALFFARPETIVQGFYARHDRTRMRIDDGEHFLSGLINYWFLTKEQPVFLEANTEAEAASEPSFTDKEGLTTEHLLGMQGYFLQETPQRGDLVIKDFEYFPQDACNNGESGMAFIDLSDERLHQITGREVRWPDRRSFIRQNHDRFSVVITEEPIPELKDQLVQFIVPDTWGFMYEVSERLRRDFCGPVVAITGSVGKSSLRLMLDHLLRQEHRVLSNRGNHNTRLAIPLYLTKLVQGPDLVNLEISLNALNSRDRGPLSQLVRPTIAILTSVDFAHMKGVKDLALMAKVKSRIFEGMAPKEIAIINQDIDPTALEVAKAAAKAQEARVMTYSMAGRQEAQLRLLKLKKMKYLTEVTVDLGGSFFTYYLKIASEGMVENSLAALLVLQALGIDHRRFKEAFESFESLPKVMALKSGYYKDKEVDLIDDTHNAAIPSMINAIQAFRDKVSYYSGAKLLVLGQVADLGALSYQLHEKLIPEIDQSGADQLLAYGEGMKAVVEKTKIPARWFDDLDEYEKAILAMITDQSLILMKGSVSGSDFNKISGRVGQRVMATPTKERGRERCLNG